jgi:hypothetical protein
VDTRKLPKLAIYLLSTLTFAAARPASADPSLRAILMPTEVGGGIPEARRDQIDLLLTQSLRNAKFAVVPAAQITPQERACHEASCLRALAEKREVDVVVGTKDVSDGRTPPSHYVTVWLYDRAKPDFVRRLDEVCRGCTVAQTDDLLSGLMRRLVSGQEGAVGPEPGQPPPTTAPILPATGKDTASAPGKKQRLALLIGAGVAAAGALASIIGLIVEATRQGAIVDCSESSSGRCKIDATGPLLLTAAGTLVFTGAAIGLFVLSRRTGNAQPSTQAANKKPLASSLWFAPTVGPGQAGFGLGGQF